MSPSTSTQEPVNGTASGPGRRLQLQGLPGQGLRHRCPLCGEQNTLRVSLVDVRRLDCTECERSFTPGELLAVIAEWQALLDWISSAPPHVD